MCPHINVGHVADRPRNKPHLTFQHLTRWCRGCARRCSALRSLGGPARSVQLQKWLAIVRLVLSLSVGACLQLVSAPCRALSSSTPRSGPLRGFLPTVFDASRRVLNRAEALAKYDTELHLFRQDVRPEQMWAMIGHLHMPEHVEIDLPEFLEGAKVAAEAQLKAINSEEFAQFAVGQVEESVAAESLKTYCIAPTYTEYKNAAKKMLEERNILMELQDFAVDAVQVTGIRYVQLTETQFEALMAGYQYLPGLWAADASVEYLQIQLVMKTVETVKLTNVDVEEVVAQQTNLRTWKFGSRVTRPEEVEWWILDSFAVNESATELSSRVYANEASADTAATECVDGETSESDNEEHERSK